MISPKIFRMTTINLSKILKTGFVMLVIASCSYPDSPKTVALKFLEAFQKHDFAEASQYGTMETRKMLKQIERIEELDKEPLPLPKGTIVIVSEETDGNTAIVYFKEKVDGEDQGHEEKLRLVKIKTEEGNMQWRVMLSKTDLKMPDPLFGPAIPDSSSTSNF
jgi:hypothetical protein